MRRIVPILLLTGATLFGTPAAPAAGEEGWGPIPTLVRRRQPAAALRALARLEPRVRERPEARYLQARLLERTGALGEAATALAGLPSDTLPAALREDARHRRARLLARSGRCAEAVPLLETLGEASTDAGAVARGLRAECLLELGRAAEAVGAFAEIVVRDPGPIDHFAARLGYAEALLAVDRRDEAVATLIAALVARPAHPDVEVARQRLAALGVSPPPFDRAQHLERAERLSRALRHEEALAELDAAGRPADRAERARWLHLRGMALYRTRHRYDEAATTLRAAYLASGRTSVEDAFHAARALARADRDADAIVAFRALVGAHPRGVWASKAEFLAAWLELRHGRAVGEAHMRRFLAGPRADASPHLARAASWELGLRAFERGRYTRAAQRFERYAEGGDGAMVRARGLYWQARAVQSAGRPQQAVAIYRHAQEVEPLHWYALLAAERLRALGEDPGPPFGTDPAGGPNEPSAADAPEERSLPPVVATYARLGLRADAVHALRAREAEVRRSATSGDGLPALLAAYAALGEANRPYHLVAGKSSHLGAPGPANRWLWDALYPHPWLGTVRRAATQQGLEPAYLYATMRQESAYDPYAVSPAEAIGLLQLLPGSARRRGEALGVRVDPEMLFEPVWNIRLGAAEIGALFRRFGGCMPLSIAAYNAGAHRVDAWRSGSAERELDHFVERIPFDETRNYVRRVMSHYARYHYLADPTGPPVAPLTACRGILPAGVR